MRCAAMTRLVIFDVDGVLIDSFRAWYEASRAGYESCGMSLSEKDFRERCWGVPFPVEFRRHVSDEEKVRKASNAVKGAFASNASRIAVFKDTIPTISKLRSKGIKIGILSNTPKHIIAPVLGAKGIPYDFMVTPPDVRPKPDAEGILALCRMAGVGKDEAVYVGDTKTDEQTGENAGVRTFIVGKHFPGIGGLLKRI